MEFKRSRMLNKDAAFSARELESPLPAGRVSDPSAWVIVVSNSLNITMTGFARDGFLMATSIESPLVVRLCSKLQAI